MLTLIPLHPTMTYEQMVATMNENLSMMENHSRTTVYTDNSGTQRIVIGYLAGGF